MDCSRARTKNPSEWLQTCPEFSQPLAEEVTDWILTAEPDLTESIKWNMLCFSARKLVCGLSACRRHLGITFFRGTELADPARLFEGDFVGNTRIRSIRLTTLEGFDRAAFEALLHAAVELDADPMVPPPPKVRREPWPMPAFFKEALAERRHHAAAENFRRLAPSCQREYLVWLTMAKRPETRARRLQATLAALARGRKWAQRKQV
ncbi:MAG TPA: YdeI/OmpD-associated family protein [Methylomirabilota bacterium]|nr:YdeI/OmpD-associated family protein [Methylomirabilota bacterium]